MKKGKKSQPGRALKLLLLKLPLAFILITVLWVAALKVVPVYVTPLMIKRSVEFRNDETFKTHHKWISYDKISPELAMAVIASEDNLFKEHNGFDRKAIQQAIEDHRKGKKLRGASTISQQTAKNVFLLPTRSIFRKAFEAYFTVLIEKIWGKERIMEVYLNSIEMGRGIYGAEAAAQQHFGHSAAQLTKRESCLIASSLPAPLKRDAAKPSNYMNKRAADIAALERKLAYPDWVTGKKSDK